MSKMRVVELFAGVGGFRAGLEAASKNFIFVWANQWEPDKKVQHAFNCYVHHFGKSSQHVNEDIEKAKNTIPSHDLLVGGFPCQDYSVARTGAEGIHGKKGVLWWSIRDILEKRQPPFVLLENVDRLVKSPASQRGRDFGIMLRCFNDLGYAVEWRVINAADYGFAQRRRRVFIFACHKTTVFYQTLLMGNPHTWINEDGFFAREFKTAKTPHATVEIDISLKKFPDLASLSNEFSANFENTGIMKEGRVFTSKVLPVHESPKTLKEIRQKKDEEIAERYFLGDDLEKWNFLKGAKKLERIKPNGDPYFYTEGGIPFPDPLDKPGRTILTSESSVNRSTHVIEDAKTGKLRLLTPIEVERLNGFEDNWTHTGMPEKMRYFCMGNALVVGLIKRIGKTLAELY